MIRGYARVSTRGQAKDGNSLEAQEKLLRENGAEKIYIDSFTGTKLDRPNLDKILDELEPGDTFMVTKLDRFARTASQGSDMITELINRGIKVHVLNIGILSNDSMSVLMRNILLAFAQFERDMIVERTQEGKAVKRAKGELVEGRPKKYDEDKMNYAMKLLENDSYSTVSKMTGISVSTLTRYKRTHTTD